MTASITADLFRTWILASGLLAHEDTAPHFAETDDVQEIARQLIRTGLLTSFQVRQLLRGRYHNFILGNKYKILDLIGVGGMGKVYLCEQLSLRRLVAVKMLQLGERKNQLSIASLIERFTREARAIAKLEDPHIVRMIDLEKIAGHRFMVMEYVDGTNLLDLVRKHGALDAIRVAHLIAQAARGLQHAAEVGIIHRDIKPSNLMLHRTGVVKILDLGLARFTQDIRANHSITSRYERDAVLGTLDWIAPEQAEDSTQADIRSDLYSLGCTMYFLLCGNVPFPAETAPEKLAMHRTQAPASLSGFHRPIPVGIIDVMERLMEKEPERRFQQPRELIHALSEWTSLAIAPPSPHEMPARPASSYRLGLSPDQSAIMPPLPPPPSAPAPAETTTTAAGDSFRRVLIGGFLSGLLGATLGGFLLWWMFR